MAQESAKRKESEVTFAVVGAELMFKVYKQKWQVPVSFRDAVFKGHLSLCRAHVAGPPGHGVGDMRFQGCSYLVSLGEAVS